jgi:hypothetical protein
MPAPTLGYPFHVGDMPLRVNAQQFALCRRTGFEQAYAWQ